MSVNSPKVFISHSSKDKIKFVLEFARKLREDEGIDAWLDKWEMQLNDNIVDKIFEQGIGGSDVFLIVLSKNALESAFVKEESSAAFSRRIVKKLKILPVVIDQDVEVPTFLSHIHRVEIRDINEYSVEFDEIVNKILGKSEKPELGNMKEIYQLHCFIPELEKRDIYVFREIGNQSLVESDRGFLSFARLSRMFGSKFDEETLESVLEILEDQFLIKIESNGSVSLTDHGFIEFCMVCLPDFELRQKNFIQILLHLEQGKEVSFEEVFHNIDLLLNVKRKLIGFFIGKGYVKGKWGAGGYFRLDSITGPGKRWFEQYLEQD